MKNTLLKPNKKTLGLIADKCGVSIMTVSRALRNSSAIKESTRSRIVEVAEQVGYQRKVKSGRPRHVSENPHRTVDVIMTMLESNAPAFYLKLLVSIERELAQRQYDCVIRTYNGEYSQFLSLCEVLRETSGSGTLILGYVEIEQLKAIFDITPQTVLVDNTGDPGFDYPYEFVGFDNVEAARLGVRHLIRTGCEKIMLIKGFPNHYFSREIEQGYREILMREYGCVDGKLIRETGFSADSAYETVMSAVEEGIKFDAVFTNDEMACGVYRALHEQGLGIPGDVSICGCDGIPIGRHLIPKLTTVILDYEQLGKISVEYLLDDNRRISLPQRIRLVPELKVRESTRQADTEEKSGLSKQNGK